MTDTPTLNRSRQHVSLSRPQGDFVEGLPEGVAIAATRSPWQQIVARLVRNPDRWYRLRNTYASTSSPANSARTVLEADYEDVDGSRIEYAYEPVPGGRFVVYLRFRRAPEVEGEDDG